MQARVIISLAVSICFILLAAMGCSLTKSMLYPAPNIKVTNPPPAYREVRVPLHGKFLSAWLHHVDDKKPVLLAFHGNGENLETMKLSGILAQLTQLGINVLAIDYPGYGKSEHAPSENYLIDAATNATLFAEQNYPNAPIYCMGWSLGAAVSAQLAARSKLISKCILMAPWSTLEDVAASHFPKFIVWMILSETYDSVKAAESISKPVLIIHGNQDRVIPVRFGKKLYGAFEKKAKNNAKLVLIPKAGHNNLFSSSTAWAEISDFLQEKKQAR